MNSDRRKKLQGIIDTLEQARADLEEIRDDEREAYDGLPDNLKHGERGRVMEETADLLDDYVDAVQDVVDNLVHLI